MQVRGVPVSSAAGGVDGVGFRKLAFLCVAVCSLVGLALPVVRVASPVSFFGVEDGTVLVFECIFVNPFPPINFIIAALAGPWVKMHAHVASVFHPYTCI